MTRSLLAAAVSTTGDNYRQLSRLSQRFAFMPRLFHGDASHSRSRSWSASPRWCASSSDSVGCITGDYLLGYAVAATDDGHKAISTDASWAVGHPEKLIAFACRTVHETSVNAHPILEAYYGKKAQKSYFVGCSDGGREALMEAQRFPEEFDGIVAGAPANNWSDMMPEMVRNVQALLGTPGAAIPPAKLAAIQKAALDACDAFDGVKDGLIEDPRACHFNPDVLACKQGTDTPDCLTQPQLTALKKIYAGPKDPRNGKQIFPGQAPGTENGMTGWSI